LFTVFVINYCSEKESLKVNILKNINIKIAYHFHERGCAVGSPTHMLHLHIQSLKRKKKKKIIFQNVRTLNLSLCFLCLCNLSMLPAAFKNMSTKKTKRVSFFSMSPNSHHRELKVSMLLLDVFSSSFFYLFSFSSSSFCFFLKGKVAWDSFFAHLIMSRNLIYYMQFFSFGRKDRISRY
jgi:hypothetical protein